MDIEAVLREAIEHYEALGLTPDSNDKMTIVIDPTLPRPFLLEKGGVIKVRTRTLKDPDYATMGIFHEVAHFYSEAGGHTEEWGQAFEQAVSAARPELLDMAKSEIVRHYEVDAELEKDESGRHSTGGTTEMASKTGPSPELLKLLTDLGFSEQEALQYATRPWEAPPEAMAAMQEWQEEQGPVVGGREEGGQYLTPTEYEMAERLAAGEELSPEDQAVLAESPSEIQTAILSLAQSIAGEEQISFDWVYNNMQLQAGSLESNEAILSLMPMLEDIAGVDFDSEGKSEDELVVTISEFLARHSGNIMVQAAVAEWGRETGNYMSPSEQAFANLIGAGASAARAKTLQMVGAQFDINPQKLFEIWENSKGRVGPTEVFGGSVDIERIGVKKTPFQIAKEYREGLDLYEGSQVLAGIHVSDPELAAKLREDPYGMDSGELRRALDYLGQGVDDEGSGSSDPQLDWIKQRLAGGYQATASVDTGAVTEALNTLAQAWNLVGVEGVTASVARDVVAGAVARARASLPNPFGPIQSGVNVVDSVQNIEARIRQRLRQTGDYQDLFGQKDAAESEEEYVARFENRSQSVLGDDDSNVVRNAMRSGNVNAVYQQALLTDAGDASTRFQEILARNAQVLREML